MVSRCLLPESIETNLFSLSKIRLQSKGWLQQAKSKAEAYDNHSLDNSEGMTDNTLMKSAKLVLSPSGSALSPASPPAAQSPFASKKSVKEVALQEESTSNLSGAQANLWHARRKTIEGWHQRVSVSQAVRNSLLGGDGGSFSQPSLKDASPNASPSQNVTRRKPLKGDALEKLLQDTMHSSSSSIHFGHLHENERFESLDASFSSSRTPKKQEKTTVSGPRSARRGSLRSFSSSPTKLSSSPTSLASSPTSPVKQRGNGVALAGLTRMALTGELGRTLDRDAMQRLPLQASFAAQVSKNPLGGEGNRMNDSPKYITSSNVSFTDTDHVINIE